VRLDWFSPPGGTWPGNPLAQLTDRRIERLLAVIDGWIDRLTFSAGRSRLPL
jgi:hypothetical protein